MASEHSVICVDLKDKKIISTHLSYFGTYCLCAARKAWLQTTVVKTLVTYFRIVLLSQFRFINPVLAPKTEHI